MRGCVGMFGQGWERQHKVGVLGLAGRDNTECVFLVCWNWQRKQSGCVEAGREHRVGVLRLVEIALSTCVCAQSDSTKRLCWAGGTNTHGRIHETTCHTHTTRACTRTQPHTDTCTHIQAHTNMHTQTGQPYRRNTHTCKNTTRIHTHTCTYTHVKKTKPHAHTHTHTPTHSQLKGGVEHRL